MSTLAHLYGALWPNIFAPSFFTVLGISLSHWRLRHHQRSHHEEVMHHLRKGSHHE